MGGIKAYISFINRTAGTIDTAPIMQGVYFHRLPSFHPALKKKGGTSKPTPTALRRSRGWHARTSAVRTQCALSAHLVGSALWRLARSNERSVFYGACSGFAVRRRSRTQRQAALFGPCFKARTTRPCTGDEANPLKDTTGPALLVCTLGGQLGGHILLDVASGMWRKRAVSVIRAEGTK